MIEKRKVQTIRGTERVSPDIPAVEKRLEKIRRVEQQKIEEERRMVREKARKKTREELIKDIEGEKVVKKVKGAVSRNQKRLLMISGVAVFLLLAVFLIYKSLFTWLIALLSLILLVFVSLIVKKRMKIYDDIKKMEDSFPDFISLMASNLRAGMTIDKALLMSSRKEFAPLDREISKLGKDIMTGKEIGKSLYEMSVRINSEEIRKTIMLIISGIRSGGNLSILLEQISSNMRERSFVRKRAASNVLMYVIFIFIAVSMGAPILFGLSTILVKVLGDIIASVPADQVSQVQIPFALTKVSVSETFIFYFSLIFIVTTDILASLVLGLVSKGKEREGLKFMAPLIAISVATFLLSRVIILRYLPIGSL